MPADPNDVEAEWAELEDAVGRGDWAAALRLVLEFEQEWKTVQGFIEIFAGPGGETWGRLMNRGMAGLLDAVAARPVDPVAVDGAMSRFRMLMPWGSKPAAMTATTATAATRNHEGSRARPEGDGELWPPSKVSGRLLVSRVEVSRPGRRPAAGCV